MQWYTSKSVKYTEMICICIKCYTNSSHAVVQLKFAPQNYTVTEGGSVNITLEVFPPSEGYDLNFTVTLQYMNGSATGERAYIALTVKDEFAITFTFWWSFVSLSLSTAGSDYATGPYTVTFSAGLMYATLMVSTMDDSTTELSEYFNVMIITTDQPGAVEIGPSDMALVTIADNDPGVCAQLKVFVHSCVFVCEYIMRCDKASIQRSNTYELRV